MSTTKHAIPAYSVQSVHAYHPALDIRDVDLEMLRLESRYRQNRWAQDWVPPTTKHDPWA